MSSRRRKTPTPALVPRLSADDLAAAMGAANKAGDLGEVHRLMLVASSNRRLAADCWRILADELAAEMTGAGAEG